MELLRRPFPFPFPAGGQLDCRNRDEWHLSAITNKTLTEQVLDGVPPVDTLLTSFPGWPYLTACKTRRRKVSEFGNEPQNAAQVCHQFSRLGGVVFVMLLALSTISCTGQTHAKSSSSVQTPVAAIGGKTIYERDIASLARGRLNQLARQEYNVKKQALDSYIDQQLLERYAKARKLTPQALLEQEADRKVQPPTERELESYYRSQASFHNQPFAKVKEHLRAAIEQQRIQQARNDYLARLRNQAGVKIYLRPPKIQVGYDPRRLRGNRDARVVIVEFSDYQCPYCRGVESTLRQVLARYPHEVSLAYRDMPLRQIHPLAEKAAEASRCAEEQGEFWAYHDLLMSNPPRLDHASLLADARTLHLNEKQFASCLTTGKYASAVEKDRETAMSLGITGTPAFFINGVLLTGDQPAAVFEKTINADLADVDQ